MLIAANANNKEIMISVSVVSKLIAKMSSLFIMIFFRFL